MMIFKRVLTGVVACSVALSVCSGADAAANKASSRGAKAGKQVATTKSQSSQTSQEAAIQGTLKSLAGAVGAGDAGKMALLWAVDGCYVDEAGVKTRGRDAISKYFQDILSGGKKVSISLEASTVKLIGSDAAWVEGTVNRQTEAGAEPATRFTMLLQNQDGNWLISSATETNIAQKTSAERLSALDWLVGEWSAQKGDKKVTMNAEWGPNKNFILCTFKTDAAGGDTLVDKQIIGWDPTRGQVVSWHFDSSGGFGYGSWSSHGNKWVVQAQGVEQTGSHTEATNILSPSGKDGFSWQSVNRNVDGVPVADGEPVSVERVSK